MLAGKGHEDYQIVGRERLPFSDRDEARRALAQARRAMSAQLRAERRRGVDGRRAAPGERRRRSSSGVSIDTRTLAAGELFVAIAGPNHDAHRFLARAAAAGAGGLVIQRGRPLPAELEPELPVIEVADTTRALGALAAGHRARFRGPVVAITGSNGKTTTKEMCAAILGQAAPCLKTLGNLNNEFGLPLTLLRRRESDRSRGGRDRHEPPRRDRAARGDREAERRRSSRTWAARTSSTWARARRSRSRRATCWRPCPRTAPP